MARYKETGHKNWKDFPSKACFQMNDTHPTIAVAELMRLLIDQEGLDWEEAWSITTQVCMLPTWQRQFLMSGSHTCRPIGKFLRMSFRFMQHDMHPNVIAVLPACAHVGRLSR